MPEIVPMPKLGFDMAEGTLVRKVKKEGEAVNRGDVLAEIETDKATVEVEATAGGVLKGWLVEEGQPVPVGAPMAVVGAADEQVDLEAMRAQSKGEVKPMVPAPGAEAQSGAAVKAAADQVSQGGAMAKVAPATEAAEPHAAQARPEIPPAAGAPRPTPDGPPAPASPIARRMADEAGIDIRLIKGTGPGGRTTKKDVEAYRRAPPAAPPVPAAPVPAPAPEDQAVPLTRLRQIIARRMTESTQTTPQFYVTVDIDMGAAMDLRKQVNALLPEERKVSVNDLVIKATALALRAFPNLNASFAGDKVIRKGHVHIGNAVSIEGGLITVVIKDADQKSLAQIAAESKPLIARAREGKVHPGDIEGSTFSISNMGMLQVDNFTAIINPPEAAILATGTVQEVPAVKNGALVPSLRMKATCSADHRVTDGAEVAQFLQVLKKNLEEPLRLML